MKKWFTKNLKPFIFFLSNWNNSEKLLFSAIKIENFQKEYKEETVSEKQKNINLLA